MTDDASEQSQASMQSSEASSADVLAALTALRQDVGRLADDVACFAQCQRGAAAAAISGAIDDAKDQVSKAASGIENLASDLEAGARTRIRGKPLTSVFFAAFIGYALRGLEGSRRSH